MTVKVPRKGFKGRSKGSWRGIPGDGSVVVPGASAVTLSDGTSYLRLVSGDKLLVVNG